MDLARSAAAIRRERAGSPGAAGAVQRPVGALVRRRQRGHHRRDSVDRLRVPIVAANAIAVALVSAVNFAGLERWVFAAATVRRSPRVPTAAVMAVLSLSLPFDASAAELTAATRRAWQRYVAATEARIERELHTPGCFLSLDFDAPADRPAGARRAARRYRDGDRTCRVRPAPAWTCHPAPSITGAASCSFQARPWTKCCSPCPIPPARGPTGRRTWSMRACSRGRRVGYGSS